MNDLISSLPVFTYLLSLQKLPDFNQVTAYLRHLAMAHISEIAEITDDIQLDIISTEKIYKEKHQKLQNSIEKSNLAHTDLVKKVENYRRIIQDLEKNFKKEGVSIPTEVPEKILYLPLESVKYCMKIPSLASAGYDLKKKKKKPFPAIELKSILEFVNEGKYDGVDWDFSTYYPSTSQLSLLNNAVKARKGVLDAERAMEMKERNEADEVRRRAMRTYMQ